MLDKLDKKPAIDSLLQDYKFYTQESTQGVNFRYTDRITGDLDLARFRDNDILCWREPILAKALKPKKIIIIDLISRFRLYSSHYDQLLTMDELFFWTFLLNNGFKIYTWTGTLEEVNTPEELAKNLLWIEPIHPQHLLKHLSQHGLSFDESFIASTETMLPIWDILYSENNDEWNTYMPFNHPFSAENLLPLPIKLFHDFFKSLEKEKKIIHLDAYFFHSYGKTQYLDVYQSIFTQFELHYGSISADCNTGRYSSFEEVSNLNKTFIENADSYLPCELAEKITVLNFVITPGDFNGDHFVNLLNRLPNLKTLNVDFAATINECSFDFDKLSPNALKHLEEFFFESDETFQIKAIEELKKRCPDLKQTQYITINEANTNYVGLLDFLIEQTEIEFRREANKLFVNLANEVLKNQPLFFPDDYDYDEENFEQSSIDPNTSPPDSPLQATDYFCRKSNGFPYPNYYRLQVYNHYEVNSPSPYSYQNHIDQSEVEVREIPFLEQDALIRHYQHNYEQTSDIYLGKITLKRGYNPTILPGLSPDDQLIALSAVPGTTITITYCQEQRLFKAQATPALPQELDIYFLLRTNVNYLFVTQQNCPQLPPDEQEIVYFIKQLISDFRFTEHGQLITYHPQFQDYLNNVPYYLKARALIEYFWEFKQEGLTNKPSEDWQILNQLIMEKKGVCRHLGTIALTFAPYLGLYLNFVQNDLHAFIELAAPNGSLIAYELVGNAAPCEIILKPFSINREEKIEKIEKVEQINQAQLLINELTKSNPYNPYLLSKQEQSYSNWTSYCSALFTEANELFAGHQNVLVKMLAQQNESFIWTMQAQAFEQKRGFFYVHDLGSIRVKESVINQEHQIEDQDSALVQFINNAQPGDVLLLNWNSLQPEHTGFNKIMDSQQRWLKDYRIPPGLVIIGFLASNAVLTKDLTNRSRLIKTVPETLAPLPSLFQPVISLSEEEKELKLIDCLLPSDWNNLLTIELGLDQGHFSVKDSTLSQELRQKSAGVVIRNAPLDDEEFKLFMAKLLLSHYWEANGERIARHPDFKIIFLNEEPTLSPINRMEQPSRSCPLVLNHSTFSKLFKGLECKNKILSETPGLIEHHTGATLALMMTEKLSDRELVKIEHVARQFNTRIEFYKPTFYQREQQNILFASDIEFAEACLRITNHFECIPINEATNNTLLERFELTPVGTKKECAIKPGHLLSLLMEGTQVLLKGTPSPTLAAQLESLLISNPYYYFNGKKLEFQNGQLKLLTEKDTLFKEWAIRDLDPLCQPFSYENLCYHESSDILKQARYLLQHYQQTFPDKKPLNFVQFQTMVEHLRNKPYSNPLKALFRLTSDYKSIKSQLEFIFGPVKSLKSPSQNSEFNKLDAVCQKIKNELNHSPYVFVVGDSGVGKSWLIRNVLAKQLGVVLFEGLAPERLLAWLQCDKEALLFIDEANLLSEESIAILDGLLHAKNPGLLLNGLWHSVDINSKKIIFAGNYGHFKDRVDHAFFRHHGHIITLKQWPRSFISTRITQPLLNFLYHETPQMVEDLNTLFLELYQEMRKEPSLNVSFRTLHTLIWRFYYLYRQQPTLSAEMILAMTLHDEFYASLKANTIIPGFDKSLYDSIKHLFKKKIALNTPDFIAVKARDTSLRLIDALMQIRALKLEKGDSSAYFTGIVGFALEGDSAEGKTSMFKSYLDHQGFVPATPTNMDAPNRYYEISDWETAKDVAHKAFHEGAVLLFDEMNTFKSEGWLNNLLTGVDEFGQKANQPGFLLFATQNPISYGNRHQYSEALRNRLQIINVKQYKEADIKEIVSRFIPDEHIVDTETRLYLEAKQTAQDSPQYEGPTVRHLLTRCEKRKRVFDEQEIERVLKKARVDEESLMEKRMSGL